MEALYDCNLHVNVFWLFMEHGAFCFKAEVQLQVVMHAKGCRFMSTHDSGGDIAVNFLSVCISDPFLINYAFQQEAYMDFVRNGDCSGGRCQLS